jgi:hypothetical protein
VADAETAETPPVPWPAAPGASAEVPLPVVASVPAPALIPAPVAAAAAPARSYRMFPAASAASGGASLFYEDFSHYREGESPGWGAGTFVKTGLDHRRWLVCSADGAHPVACRIRLPGTFSFECRYSVYLPEVTRGILGWWKEPVSTTIAFPDAVGGRCAVEWMIRYGNDPTQINPVGSSSLFARKYYHTIRLPDGSANEVGVAPATGLLRIDINKNDVQVFMDGQAIVAGSMTPAGQLVGFEANLVKGANGMLFFTDFKITR